MNETFLPCFLSLYCGLAARCGTIRKTGSFHISRNRKGVPNENTMPASYDCMRCSDGLSLPCRRSGGRIFFGGPFRHIRFSRRNRARGAFGKFRRTGAGRPASRVSHTAGVRQRTAAFFAHGNLRSAAKRLVSVLRRRRERDRRVRLRRSFCTQAERRVRRFHFCRTGGSRPRLRRNFGSD